MYLRIRKFTKQERHAAWNSGSNVAEMFDANGAGYLHCNKAGKRWWDAQ